MSKLAIIPARSGSKRLKNKNTLSFDGKPLVAWTIEQAIGSGTYDRIILSTDSEEIASIGTLYGLNELRLRPNFLATDHSPIEDTIVHVLEELKLNDSYIPDSVSLLQPTSPLRSVSDIQAAMALFEHYNHTTTSRYSARMNWKKFSLTM